MMRTLTRVHKAQSMHQLMQGRASGVLYKYGQLHFPVVQLVPRDNRSDRPPMLVQPIAKKGEGGGGSMGTRCAEDCDSKSNTDVCPHMRRRAACCAGPYASLTWSC